MLWGEVLQTKSSQCARKQSFTSINIEGFQDTLDSTVLDFFSLLKVVVEELFCLLTHNRRHGEKLPVGRCLYKPKSFEDRHVILNNLSVENLRRNALHTQTGHDEHSVHRLFVHVV